MLNANGANTILGETEPPEHLVGMMIGAYSAIAGVSNLFVPPLAGYVLDNFGEQGYRFIFAGICVSQFISILCGVLLKKSNKSCK